MTRFLLRLTLLAWLLPALAPSAVSNETPVLAKSPLEPEAAKAIQERWARHLGKEVVESNSLGVKKPNAFGLYDVHGGVWEWCADRYDPDYYFTSPLVDPKGPQKGLFGVLRGDRIALRQIR